MEIFSGVTAKTKETNLRVNKAIQLLLVQCNDTFDNMSNETIKAYIETKDGANVQLIPSLRIKPLFILSQLGEGSGIEVGGVTQLPITLAKGNALELENDETLIIDATNLRSAQTYDLDGFESPIIGRQALTYSTKKVLAGEAKLDLDLRGYTGMVIDNMSQISSLELTFVNGRTCKYNSRELKFLANGAQNGNDLVIGSDVAANVKFGFAGGFLALAMQNVSSLYLERDSTVGEMEVILQKPITY
jgi:hypothetical protein